MTPYDPGDVVLVRFPFTDLSTAKKRPALVLSPSAYSLQHGDAVLLALTSQPQQDKSSRLSDWKKAGLLKPTWIKPIVGTISDSEILKKLGKLTNKDLPRVKAALQLLVAAKFLP